MLFYRVCSIWLLQLFIVPSTSSLFVQQVYYRAHVHWYALHVPYPISCQQGIWELHVTSITGSFIFAPYVIIMPHFITRPWCVCRNWEYICPFSPICLCQAGQRFYYISLHLRSWDLGMIGYLFDAVDWRLTKVFNYSKCKFITNFNFPHHWGH